MINIDGMSGVSPMNAMKDTLCCSPGANELQRKNECREINGKTAHTVFSLTNNSGLSVRRLSLAQKITCDAVTCRKLSYDFLTTCPPEEGTADSAMAVHMHCKVARGCKKPHLASAIWNVYFSLLYVAKQKLQAAPAALSNFIQ